MGIQENMIKTVLSAKQKGDLLAQVGPLQCILGIDNCIQYCSPELIELLGTDSEEQIYKNVMGSAFTFSICKQLISYGLLETADWQIRNENCLLHRVQLSGVLLDSEHILIIANKKYSNSAQQLSNKPFPFLEKGLLLLDSDGVVMAANLAFYSLLGVSNLELHGSTFKTICQDLNCSGSMGVDYLNKLTACDEIVEAIFNPHWHDVKRYVYLRVYPLTEMGHDVAYVVALQDITPVRISEERIHFLAHHDALTGLPNKAQFIAQVGKSVCLAKRSKGEFAVLFMDLDDFKTVNDSLGHQAGDDLLKEIGNRIRKTLRESDVAARFGGDEFCVLIDQIGNEQDAAHLAARFLQQINKPYQLRHQTVWPRASIGISLYPHNGETPEDLLHAADTAMYDAKQKGKYQFAFHSAAMTDQIRKKMELESALHQALPLQQFELYYQPIIDLRSGHLRCVEALIRWNHPEFGMIPPDQFISTAERLGLSSSIGCWVLEAACQQLIDWQNQGTGLFRIAVNISSDHFEQPHFVEDVSSIIKKTGINPKWLDIEITESLARNVQVHLHTCADLDDLGVNVSIDDFGTGYSSLSVLNQLRVNTLKIDKMFIDNILYDSKTVLMLGGIVAMAKGLGLDIVIEGVESFEQLNLLCGLGCTLAQGFYFSKPVPAEIIPQLASNNFLPSTDVLSDLNP